jgi:predicted Ser/Thr protein kinase
MYNEADEDNPLLPGPYKNEREIDHRDYDDEYMDNIRMWCTEPKILDHVTNEFGRDAESEVLLYTEQKPCKEACQSFIREFQNYFTTGGESSNVDLNISYTFVET